MTSLFLVFLLTYSRLCKIGFAILFYYQVPEKNIGWLLKFPSSSSETDYSFDDLLK
jgi:hypothetical protein